MKTKNFTPMPLGTRVTARKPRRPEMTVVVRGKFRLVHGGTVELIEDPMNPLVQGFMTADVFDEDDDDLMGESLYPSDFADFKLHGEAMLKGACHTPNGKPLPECPVRFSVGKWSKSLRVVGRRVFSDGLSGAALSEPVPFTKMPITWANAYGGPGFDENPVGKGVASADAPTIEAPGSPMRSRSDRIAAAGFGPINPQWKPRASKRGVNYGPAWRKERAPFYSDDFDWTHFQSAPSDQWMPYLKGDEVLQFQNLDPKIQLLETRLPGIAPRAFVVDDKAVFREVKLTLDTLFADLDEGVVYLTWRGLDEVRDDDLGDVSTLMVLSEPIGGAGHPIAHYQELVRAFEADPIGFEETKRKLLPDMGDTTSKREKFDAFQKTLAESANSNDPDAFEKVAIGALDLVDGEHADALKKQIPEMLAKAKKEAEDRGEKQLHAGFADALKKPAPPSNLVHLKPGEPPALGAKEMASSLQAAKEKLPELDKQIDELGRTSPEEAEKIRGMLEQTRKMLDHPMLVGLGTDPPEALRPGPGRDLSGRDFQRQDLRGVDFSACKLVGTLFTDANLAGARFAGAHLERALLGGADLTDANFSNATITESILNDANASGANFSGATFRFSGVHGAKFRLANFEDADCSMLALTSTDFTGARATKARFHRCFWNEAKLDDVNFDRATIDNCVVRASTATKASFVGATLLTAAFLESDLTGATFAESKGEVAIFLKSTLTDAEFRYADLFRSHFTEAKMDRAQFVSADLRGSRFYRTVLTRTNFETANLIRADLSKANLERARFRGANLYEACLQQAFGHGTDFTNANVKRALMERA